jgi:hypothetical protein
MEYLCLFIHRFSYLLALHSFISAHFEEAAKELDGFGSWDGGERGTDFAWGNFDDSESGHGKEEGLCLCWFIRRFVFCGKAQKIVKKEIDSTMKPSGWRREGGCEPGNSVLQSILGGQPTKIDWIASISLSNSRRCAHLWPGWEWEGNGMESANELIDGMEKRKPTDWLATYI